MLIQNRLLFGYNCSVLKSILLFILTLNTPSVTSQILKTFPEHTRVNQKINTTNLYYSNHTYVGNYTVLNPSEVSLQDYFQSISNERYGTLFMVVRPKSDTLSDKRLLKLGRISLYRDSLMVDGNSVGIEPIRGESVLLKVKFQGRSRRSWMAKHYHIGTEVDLAELVYYQGILPEKESRIVESLLAIKYSINITKNEEPKFRDYTSIYGEVIWDQKGDAFYDEHVMALGRMDRVGFFQSQSYSSDTEEMRIGLDSLISASLMPEVQIQDSSLLMVLKGNEKLTLLCGGNPADFLFKIKFFNWQSSADTLFLEADTLYGFNQIFLSDGYRLTPLGLNQSSNTTIFKVPLVNLDFQKSYYIVGVLPPDSCHPIYNLNFNYCDSNSQNSLNLSLDTAALPANCKLIDVSRGYVMDTILVNPYARFMNLDMGQYELIVSNDDGRIFQSVFELQECPSSFYQTTGTPSGNGGDIAGWNFSNDVTAYEFFSYSDPSSESVSKASGPTVKKDLSPNKEKENGFDNQSSDYESIDFYPNPITRGDEVDVVFSNLNDIPFNVQVIDNKGAVLREYNFTPSIQGRTFSQRFNQPGTYLIRAISSEYFAHQTIIVK